MSVFAPWADGGYAVADVPEAVWFEPAGSANCCTSPTPRPNHLGPQTNVTLAPQRWSRRPDGTLEQSRIAEQGHARGKGDQPRRRADGFRVTNGSATAPPGSNDPKCVYAKGLTGFDMRTIDNKMFAARSPRAATPRAAAR